GVSAGEPWKVNEMLRGWMGTEPSTPGFLRRPIVMREFVVTGPETRQVLFGRTGFTRPGYGHIYPDSPRGVSPFTHHGLVLPIDDDLRWYTDVLGLQNRDTHDLDYSRPGNRVHLELRPGQRLKFTRFGSGDAAEGLLFTFQPYSIAPDARMVAQPGALGITLHSFQTPDLEGVRADSIAFGCPTVSAVLRNEFGEPSVGLMTPSGVWWALVGR
ncbi:MAG: hypothetical protein NZ518_06670, partial [Dehalococcoidia bacterium]|nr:hypothetical protein [Dehalococcoidia bacterium]